jgi:hypothetical protein
VIGERHEVDFPDFLLLRGPLYNLSSGDTGVFEANQKHMPMPNRCFRMAEEDRLSVSQARARIVNISSCSKGPRWSGSEANGSDLTRFEDGIGVRPRCER